MLKELIGTSVLFQKLAWKVKKIDARLYVKLYALVGTIISEGYITEGWESTVAPNLTLEKFQQQTAELFRIKKPYGSMTHGRDIRGRVKWSVPHKRPELLIIDDIEDPPKK